MLWITQTIALKIKSAKSTMQNFWATCSFSDILAALFFIGAVALKFFKLDGTVDIILVSIVAYYFGRRSGISQQTNV